VIHHVTCLAYSGLLQRVLAQMYYGPYIKGYVLDIQSVYFHSYTRHRYTDTQLYGYRDIHLPEANSRLFIGSQDKSVRCFSNVRVFTRDVGKMSQINGVSVWHDL
jgi:hypothetical protein